LPGGETPPRALIQQVYSLFVNNVFDDQEKKREGNAQYDLRIQANDSLTVDQIERLENQEHNHA
jgi:hypothetical protein